MDDTLVIAIIGDFDLSNHEHFTQARSILEGLAQNVTTEEASGFNAVPIAEDDVKLIGPVNDLASHDYLAEAGSSNATTNSPSLPVDFADLTDLTDFSESLEERFAALELPKDVNIATLDNEGKVAELQTMFPGLVRLDLELTLRKCKGDFMQACEELLNMQFLEENGLRPKGIDGAFRPDGEIGYKGKIARSFPSLVSTFSVSLCPCPAPPHHPAYYCPTLLSKGGCFWLPAPLLNTMAAICLNLLHPESLLHSWSSDMVLI